MNIQEYKSQLRNAIWLKIQERMKNRDEYCFSDDFVGDEYGSTIIATHNTYIDAFQDIIELIDE